MRASIMQDSDSDSSRSLLASVMLAKVPCSAVVDDDASSSLLNDKEDHASNVAT